MEAKEWIEKSDFLFFDLDGTLIDSREDIARSLEKSCRKFPHPYQMENFVIGPPIRDIVAMVMPELPLSDYEEMVKDFRKNYSESAYAHTRLYGGVQEFLEQCRQKGKPMYLATNKPLSSTMEILEKLDLVSFFTYVGTPDCEPGFVFNKQQILEYILNKYHLNPESCLMFGDTLGDVKAAKVCGMKTLAHLNGYGSGEELKSSNPNGLFRNYLELIASGKVEKNYICME